MIWAVVPAKIGKAAKERLADALPPDLRERLAEAMLLDVLQALGGCRDLDATVVVSRDEAALALARAAGAQGVRERGGGGLNPAVREGVAHCAKRGASGVVIAMSDLPLLQCEDVTSAIAQLPLRGLVLVPSADGTGTNLVVARPADLFQPQFGPGSLARHREESRRGNIQTIVHERPGAALDIDTPNDLERLRRSAKPESKSGDLLSPGRVQASIPLGTFDRLAERSTQPRTTSR